MVAGGRTGLMAGVLCAAWLLAVPAQAAGVPPPVPDELRTLADTVLARLSAELDASGLGTASFEVEALVTDPLTGSKPPQVLGTVERRAASRPQAPWHRPPLPGRKPASAALDALARAFVERIGPAYRGPDPSVAN